MRASLYVCMCLVGREWGERTNTKSGMRSDSEVQPSASIRNLYLHYAVRPTFVSSKTHASNKLTSNFNTQKLKFAKRDLTKKGLGFGEGFQGFEKEGLYNLACYLLNILSLRLFGNIRFFQQIYYEKIFFSNFEACFFF